MQGNVLILIGVLLIVVGLGIKRQPRPTRYDFVGPIDPCTLTNVTIEHNIIYRVE